MPAPDAPSPGGLSYRDAGVDIDAGERLVARIRPIAERTRRPGVLEGLGGFGALFELPVARYRRPVLVAGTDGVGTKLRLALALDRHETVGIDLVAMCANDVVVQGAEPLFFLDYYATGRLDVEVAARVVTGIGRGCELAGMALVGGETAEMPGMYREGDYDLAGFCVGVAERDRLLPAPTVEPGDRLLGLASSGAHSNGYALIRRILELRGVDPAREHLEGRPLADWLLEPTRIYVRPLLELVREGLVKACAHVTGGGLPGNLPRVLPEGVEAVVDLEAWPRPALFRWLQEAGGVAEAEMLRTFNCGLGMILVVAPEHVAPARELLEARGERVFEVGRLERARGPARVRFPALEAPRR